MAPYGQEGWEPDSRKMDNWRSMFEGGGPGAGQPVPPAEPATLESDDAFVLDTTEYLPWVMQRVRNSMAPMLHLRRFEPKSDRWVGWLMPWHSLCAVDYLGHEIITLDYGIRQVVLQGHGLDELAQRLQQGTVLVVQEYASVIWPVRPTGPIVSAIRRLGTPPGAPA